MRFKAGTDPSGAENVIKAIADGEAKFGKTGRLLIRKSGTEPLVRVMGECEDKTALTRVVDNICDEVSRV